MKSVKYLNSRKIKDINLNKFNIFNTTYKSSKELCPKIFKMEKILMTSAKIIK